MNNYNYGYYVVAFIDVLGQKEAFQDIVHLPTNEQEKQKLMEADKDTVYFIEILRDFFKKTFDEITKDKEAMVKVADENKEQFDKIRKAKLKHVRFSDCIQAFVPLYSEEYHAPCINGIFSLLGATGAIMLFSLSGKKPLRAGIDVGIGTELSGGEVYGPGFFNAYKLESKIAQYPRIVIGNEFINYLKNLIHETPQSSTPIKEDIKACAIIAKRCIDLIVKDSDGYYILDYLGKGFQENFIKGLPGIETGEYLECIKKAKLFAEEEQVKWETKGDNKLASRYALLCNYFRNKEKAK